MMRIVPARDVRGALPDVAEAMAELEQAASEARRVKVAWHASRPGSLHAENHRREYRFLERASEDARVRLASLGVLAADLEAGTVEIPTLLGGEMVHVVADVGAGEVTHVRRLVGGERLEPWDVVRHGAPEDADAVS